MKSSKNENLTIKIKDLQPKLRNITSTFIVLEKRKTFQTQHSQTLSTFLVADETAAIQFTIWDYDCSYIKEGDILFLTGGYTFLYKDQLVLYTSKYGSVSRIGEFTMVYVENNMSEYRWNSDQNGKWVSTPPNQIN
ncbi:ob fold nucleic acid binding protein-related [Anaeramoeba ignava]|uniref:Ob fold nucleic acid binding protein-related n=1 Tax=Anaeramoeba ignava TaxID=1746090 RepID=A0A9Q0RFF7_ANAIG|nr:ob fold nucleic acid binding protein-related [Anaeramoeba ignava]